MDNDLKFATQYGGVRQLDGEANRRSVVAGSPVLPIAWLAAALNAFAEEVLYRAGPLGPLARVVGPRAGSWILAVWFGLSHVYGGIHQE